MKLPIKKKFFDQIKNGKKQLEWRDAHITFVCEETGEKLRKEVKSTRVMSKGTYNDWEDGMFESVEEFEAIFEDDRVICFELE